uniref:ABC transporter C family member 3 n=1 Tax=Talaromyces marneffei PM1 TaxID=1077442 RepID=A0A093UV48_TALMA
MRQFPQSVLASSTYLPGIELSLLPEPVSNTGTLSENQTDTILSMKNVDFRWEASPPDRTGVTLTLKSSPIGNLIAVIGPVGSACGLDLDFKRMPAGDETLMGSNSAKLSGGQRQRVISFPVPSMILLGQDYIRGYIQGLETQSNQITEVEGSINSDNDRLEPPRIATGPLGTPAALYSRYTAGSLSSCISYWLGLYGAFSVIEAIALSLAVFMLRAYVSAPLYFLSNVRTGDLITRFSQDINTNIQTQESLTEWPDRGEIAFVNTSIGYSGVEQAKPIVNGLHLHISIGEKIGLCGRTGSGKSTLALSLLRLTELVSGRILIDGQDVTLISKSFLRQRVSCLSQEAFLFPGTIRQNADPLNNMTNTEIINALRCVELWDALVAIHGGNEEVVLDAKLNDSNLSHGQKFSFLMNPLVETDAKVQMVIRKSFRECTVIMVAHRIHILLDFDRVAVLDSGRVVEVGQPLELMLKPHGGFSKLLDLES